MRGPTCTLLVLLAALPLLANGNTLPKTVDWMSEPCIELPPGFASDHWVEQGSDGWAAERERRRDALAAYYQNEDEDCAKQHGFRAPQNPKVGWDYYTDHPIGYGGVPYVLLTTLLSLDPATESDEHLKALAHIWRKPTQIDAEVKTCQSDPAASCYTLDHLGIGPHPHDYDENGAAVAPDRRQHLPNGLVYDPNVVPEPLGWLASAAAWVDPDWRCIAYGGDASRCGDQGHGYDDAEREAVAADHGWWATQRQRLFRYVADRERRRAKAELESMWDDLNVTLDKDKKKFLISKVLHRENYDQDIGNFQQPPAVDAVFFACSTCHQGRIIVDDEMQFIDGMPNTEVEAQYYSQLLMETGFALLDQGGGESPAGDAQAAEEDACGAAEGTMLRKAMGAVSRALFGSDEQQQPQKSWDKDTNVPPTKENVLERVRLNKPAVCALFKGLVNRVLADNAAVQVYGDDPLSEHRAYLQTYWVANDFIAHVFDLIGVAVKTQYVYGQIAGQYSFREPQPDLMNHRIGQMDAFGIASGLVAIHTYRPENSFIRALCRDNPDNPLFAITGATPGPECDPEQLEAAAAKIRDTLADWAPPVPAPVDIPSLSWTGHRVLANWDGNQGAAARTLASGTSATGDPTKVNVRIHEPLNPLINHMPPPPYPFEVDQEKAREGRKIFYGKGICWECHVPHSDEVVPLTHSYSKFLPLMAHDGPDAALLRLTGPEPCRPPNLCTDGNRTVVNTPVSRYALAGLVLEACNIFIENTGNEWCLPHDDRGAVIRDWETVNDDYFKDTPGRVAKRTHGYKVDMQHGIWARAPYLHNGSVPTLGHLLCPQTRPKKFLRGVINNYDQDMVGFEWHVRPSERYTPHETQLVKEYDTSVNSRSNRGHEFGRDLCPPGLDELDPIADSAEIAHKIADSEAGKLIEYMKTF